MAGGAEERVGCFTGFTANRNSQRIRNLTVSTQICSGRRRIGKIYSKLADNARGDLSDVL